MIDETGLTKAPDLAKLLDLYNSQTNTVNTLWNVYLTVNLAILGLLYKEPHMGDDWKIKMGFTLGFFVFAFANSMAIQRSQKILYAICEFLRNLKVDKTSKVGPILLAHGAISPTRILIGHWIFSVMVALVIWVPEIQKALNRG